MRKVINGKVYDTNTAQKLHGWSNECGSGDLAWYVDTLFRTKKGAYFICGIGGARSKYITKSEDDTICGGSGMEVISARQAVQWLEDHDGSDVIVAQFAEYVEEA